MKTSDTWLKLDASDLVNGEDGHSMALVLLYLTSIVTVTFTLALLVHGSFAAALLVMLIGSILIYFEMKYIVISKG